MCEYLKEDENVHLELHKPEDKDRFIVLVNSLAAVMEDNKDTSQPPPETASVSTKAKPLLAPFIHTLFSTLSTYWNCTRDCKDSHRAALALSTNRTSSANVAESPSFTVLLSKPTSPNLAILWLETGITVKEGPSVTPAAKQNAVQTVTRQKTKRNPAVRFAQPDTHSTRSATIKDLCAVTRETKRNRINLSVIGSSLSRHNEPGDRKAMFGECEPVSFIEGFLKNSTELSLSGKICLAVVLSHSFLDFCGRPWVIGGWAAKNLHLMQTGVSLMLRPFLITDMVQRKERYSAAASLAVLKAKLRDHGKLLMQVFQQDSDLPAPNQPPSEAKDAIETWFKSIDWDVCEQTRQAVEACIDGTLLDSLDIPLAPQGKNAPSTPRTRRLTTQAAGNLDEAFAKVFHQRVLAPLEADFVSLWPDADPDQVVSGLKLPSTRPSSGLTQSRRRVNSRNNLAPCPSPYLKAQHQTRSSTCSPSLANPSLANLRLGQGRFFDSSNDVDNAE